MVSPSRQVLVDSSDSDHQQTDFYEDVLKDMQSKRKAETTRRRKHTKSLDAHLMGGSSRSSTSRTDVDTCMSDSSSLHSFLSWASTSHSRSTSTASTVSTAASTIVTLEDLESTFTAEKVCGPAFWRDRAHGKVKVSVTLGTGTGTSFAKKTKSMEGLPELLAKWNLSKLDVPSTPTYTSTQSQRSRPSSSVHKKIRDDDHSEMAESFRQLQYSRDDLQFLAFGESRDFRKLQRSLRKEGAVTNELLKQVLPMVVAQSQQRRKAKQRQAEEKRRMSLEKILEMEPDEQAKAAKEQRERRGRQARGAPPRKPVRTLSPIQQAYAFLRDENRVQEGTYI